jgi:hypothetical protein
VQEDNPPDVPERMSTDEGKMPLNDLMASWFRGQELGEKAPPEADDIDMKPQDSAEFEQDDDDSRASALGYQDFVLNTEAFRWLLTRLHTEFRLVSTEPKAMEAIRQNIVSSLKSNHVFSRKALPEELKVIFKLDWDLLAFFEQQQYTETPAEALPKIITLTGSGQDSQAITCAEYLTQTWPLTGDVIIKLVQDMLNSEPGIPKSGKSMDFSIECAF